MLLLNISKRSTWIGLLLFAISFTTELPAAAQDFSIVVLPDTQYYSQYYPATFTNQTQWIVDNKDTLNIVYVAHEGDIVNTASSTVQWDNADTAMSLLEDPVTTGLPDGIPYGVVPGNHDEPTTEYNNYFGVSRFSDKNYYGGSYTPDLNDSNYTLLSASGMNLIFINLEYASPPADLLDWADYLLKTYCDYHAIVVSHNILNYDGSFGSWGQQVYDALKDNPNLFLMLSGHVHGEAMRVEEYNGNTVHILLADYQDRPNGGNGWLRIMEFSPENDVITVTTYSPLFDQYGTDEEMGVNTTSGSFTINYDMANLNACLVPDIKANDSDGPIYLNIGETLSLTIILDPGSYPGMQADWWALSETPFGWYHFDYSSGTWKPGLSVTFQGPLSELGSTQIMNMAIPEGSYTFYFGVDGIMNGKVDLPSMFYDSVEVTVTP